MLHVQQTDLYKKRYATLWSLLSFKAGLINASGFLIVGSFVSHVTGFGSLLGVSIVHDQYKITAEVLLIPITFILGSCYVGYTLDKNYSEKTVPNYPKVQIVITFFIGLICFLFSTKFFTMNNPLAVNDKSIILVSLLCFICGLKNGLTTWATQGKIRTTHMTGISTDIGIHLHKMFRDKNTSTRFPESKKVNTMRIITLISFSIGSCFSAILIPVIGYKIFYICFLLSFVFSIISWLHKKHLTQKMNFEFNQEEIQEETN